MDLHSSNPCCSKVIIRKPQKEGKKITGREIWSSFGATGKVGRLNTVGDYLKVVPLPSPHGWAAFPYTLTLSLARFALVNEMLVGVAWPEVWRAPEPLDLFSWASATPTSRIGPLLQRGRSTGGTVTWQVPAWTSWLVENPQTHELNKCSLSYITDVL